MRKKPAGGRTDSRRRDVRVQLHPVVWEAVQDIAAQQGRSAHELVTEIARDALTVAIHLYVAEFYGAEAAPEEEPDAQPARTCR